MGLSLCLVRAYDGREEVTAYSGLGHLIKS